MTYELWGMLLKCAAWSEMCYFSFKFIYLIKFRSGSFFLLSSPQKSYCDTKEPFLLVLTTKLTNYNPFEILVKPILECIRNCWQLFGGLTNLISPNITVSFRKKEIPFGARLKKFWKKIINRVTGSKVFSILYSSLLLPFSIFSDLI